MLLFSEKFGDEDVEFKREFSFKSFTKETIESLNSELPSVSSVKPGSFLLSSVSLILLSFKISFHFIPLAIIVELFPLSVNNGTAYQYQHYYISDVQVLIMEPSLFLFCQTTFRVYL